MKIAGIILIVIGLVDLIGSYAGFDLWGTMGIQLPDVLWKFSSYIEIVAGYMLFKAGSGGDAPEGEEEAA